MRVVHVYKDYYPPMFGGIEQTVQRMATRLVAAGGEATVLTSAHGGHRTIEETIDGVRVVRVAEWARALSAPFCPSMPYHLSRLKADLYHLHYPNPTGEVSWLMVRPKGAMVVSYHGDVIRQAAIMPVYRPFVHAVLRNADAIIASTDREMEFSEFLKQYRAKCTVVPYGVDLEPFERVGEHAAAAERLRASHGTPLIVFVGRLVYYKGLDVLLQAMPEIRGSLVIVGDGPERERLEAQRRALGLDGRVVFAGRASPADLVAHLAAADLGVLPSSHPTEMFGISMVEMMAAGLPVVCTELGTGTSFVNVNGETGLVVPPREPRALAEAINRITSDTDLRRRMGEAARARAQRLFSIDAMVGGVTAVYGKALAQRKAG